MQLTQCGEEVQLSDWLSLELHLAQDIWSDIYFDLPCIHQGRHYACSKGVPHHSSQENPAQISHACLYLVFCGLKLSLSRRHTGSQWPDKMRHTP
ncbi:uncharacterized protein LOC142586043 isoform X2 [Dermacentor variabilis]|uniref:uncharacterized protein LOC142586043 isoform X2 n=1 Tax=Dermacentor variabilis TaxID=34621 RepID=UPI003F5C4AEE